MLDALVSQKLGELLRHKNQNKNANIKPAMLNLEVGDMVSYMIGSKAAATGTLTFIGSNGIQTRYRNSANGINKVLFKIEQINVLTSKPLAFSTSAYSIEYTLSDIYQHLELPIIILRMLSIEKPISFSNSILIL